MNTIIVFIKKGWNSLPAFLTSAAALVTFLLGILGEPGMPPHVAVIVRPILVAAGLIIVIVMHIVQFLRSPKMTVTTSPTNSVIGTSTTLTLRSKSAIKMFNAATNSKLTETVTARARSNP